MIGTNLGGSCTDRGAHSHRRRIRSLDRSEPHHWVGNAAVRPWRGRMQDVTATPNPLPDANEHASPVSTEFRLAEYGALREEILQLQEEGHKLVTFQAIASGAIFSYALGDSTRIDALLVLPVITFLLGSRYHNSQRSLIRAGDYIRSRIEPKSEGGLNWGEYLAPGGVRGARGKINRPIITMLTFAAFSVVAVAFANPFTMRGDSIAPQWARWLLFSLDLALIMVSIVQTLMKPSASDAP